MNTSNIYEYEAIGTKWKISIFDDISKKDFDYIKTEIFKISQTFDDTYSRFIETSLISKISNKIGIFKVYDDLIDMLNIYKDFYNISNYKINPLISNTLSDLGYDKNYSLKEKSLIRKTPDLNKVIEITNDNKINLKEEVEIDLGAIGKGYLIDKIVYYLKNKKLQKFIVDGSGDIYFYNNLDKEKMKIGLEHPKDNNKIIGIVEIYNQAICSSSITRRAWRNHNHYIDPDTSSSPKNILSTWAISKSAVISDAMSSCLFFENINNLQNIIKNFPIYSNQNIKYCRLDKNLTLEKSDNFEVELY